MESHETPMCSLIWFLISNAAAPKFYFYLRNKLNQFHYSASHYLISNLKTNVFLYLLFLGWIINFNLSSLCLYICVCVCVCLFFFLLLVEIWNLWITYWFLVTIFVGSVQIQITCLWETTLTVAIILSKLLR